MSDILINRVANSSLKTINLETFYPKVEIVSFDIQPFLFKGLILREKEFRAALKEYDWSSVQDKIVCVHCSADAIVPIWAYMLIATYCSEKVNALFHGTPDEYLSFYYQKLILETNWDEYQDQRIVVKGCSDQAVPVSAYQMLTHQLTPIAKSIMFGEPCSTVPVFKKKR